MRFLLPLALLMSAPVSADLLLNYNGFYGRMKKLQQPEYSDITLAFALTGESSGKPCQFYRIKLVSDQHDMTLDMAGNGFSTSGLSRPVSFDLDADGRMDSISVPTGDDALLAYDRNGNGRIDDGRELFGDQHGAANGFAELGKYDDNADGRIDAQDAIFERLSLLRFDAQGRQSTQTLSQAGVSAIELQARDVQIALGAYDEIAQLGRFEFADGRSGQAADLLLAQR